MISVIAATGATSGEPLVVVLLAAVAAVAERGRIELRSQLSASISLVPTLFAAVLFGPLAAAVVAAASLLPEFHPPYLRWSSYTASRMITAILTGVVAQGVLEMMSGRLTGVAVATLAGAFVSQTLDTGFAALRSDSAAGPR